MAYHLVKLIDPAELQGWETFPVYEAFNGRTIAQYRDAVKAGKQKEMPVLFISHRWESAHHPDPDGKQLKKLKPLKDCFIIYDYVSFPQDTSTPEKYNTQQEVLHQMNLFIDNLVVINGTDYMTRGWCLYEYISAALRHRIVCDEISDPAIMRLRNVVATHPNPPGIDSTHREAVNAKNQFVLEAVNKVLPVFGKSEYTKPGDKAIVQHLLIELLRNNLPKKQEYIQYVGEWKTSEWTTAELAAAFVSKLEWEPLQYDPTTPVFEPVVPDSIAKAVTAGYAIAQQPDNFGNERYEMDFSGAGRIVLIIKVVGVILILLALWGAWHLVRPIFGM